MKEAHAPTKKNGGEYDIGINTTQKQFMYEFYICMDLKRENKKQAKN